MICPPLCSAQVESDSVAQTLTDRPVRDVVDAVAHYQIHTLLDGNYPKGAWNDVMTARAATGVTWFYPWGVTLYGMLRATEATGNPSYRDFVVAHNEITARYWKYLSWMRGNYSATHGSEVNQIINSSSIWRLMAMGSLDNTGSMSSQMLEELLRHNVTATMKQNKLLRSVADYIYYQQSRLPDGTFWRPEANQTLWIDDLYMSCPFLVRWYQYSGERMYLDDAARQVIGMAQRQQDSDGLWYHGNFIAQGITSPYKWGRANGWAMVATLEVLSAMPENDPNREALLSILRRHIDGIKPLQAPSGMWRQVLDHSELWEETSCTAMFAYSIARAVRRGWIGPENLDIAKRAFAGLSNNVTADGQVNGTCEGTSIGTTLDYYINRQRPPNDPLGPGPVLLAGCELLDAEKQFQQ